MSWDIGTIDDMHRHKDRFARQTVYDYLCALTETDYEMDEVLLQWRKARAAYELAMLKSTPREKREALLREAKRVLKRCSVMDRNNGEMRRWLGLVVVALSEFESTAEQVSASYDALDQWRQAVEINPADVTAHHLLGCWAYDQAAWSWWYHWWVSTLYAEPPNATWADAREAFASAERIAPGSWKKNQLMLARTYNKMGDTGRAAQWCKRALQPYIFSAEDLASHHEAMEMLKALDPGALQHAVDEEGAMRKLEAAEIAVDVEERTDGFKGETAPPTA